MDKKTFIIKNTGDTLSADEWNELTGYTNDIVDAINKIEPTPSGDSPVVVSDDTQTGGDPAAGVSIISGVDQIGTAKVIELTKKKKGVNTTLTSDNNINIEPRESVNETKGGNISFKPGDDIEFCSHHRLADNQDEVSVKVIDGDDNPVKLQVNLNSLTLTTKDSIAEKPEVLDVYINAGKNDKGYLKVRAQAIDLRCEEHGGIALQPKGFDSNNNMNKIKFEHGGGDGLEFGTFNTEKTSIFTDEYRFKKDGLWIPSTREVEQSAKYDDIDETTHYKYVKQSDDFYDNINFNDPVNTTNNILRTSDALNPATGDVKLINGGDVLELQMNPSDTRYVVVQKIISSSDDDILNYFDFSELSTREKANVDMDFSEIPYKESHIYDRSEFFEFFDIDSNPTGIGYITINDLGLAHWIIVNFGDGGIVKSFEIDNTDCHFSVMSDSIYTLTNDICVKQGITDHTTLTYISGGRSAVSCDIQDIIKLVNYMKTNNQGPWASNA